jgi:DNA polymerase elongation subunit (family B)
MDYTFRLCDFNISNKKIGDDEEDAPYMDEEEDVEETESFNIQMFGLNERGETCSIVVEDYTPFFYVKVPPFWTTSHKNDFQRHLAGKIGAKSIVDCSIIQRKKLYGFDGKKDHKFVILKFANMSAFNRAKNIWYYNATDRHGEKERRLIRYGYKYQAWNLELYEANIPPLLRFFHINEISPSGWIMLKHDECRIITNKTTTCTYEFAVHFKSIVALNDKETRVPYKICSFDIEASSSHGDFPLPVKNYKKLAVNIVDYFGKLVMDISPAMCKSILKKMILSAFGYDKMPEIDLVYPKRSLTKPDVLSAFESWINCKVRDYKSSVKVDKNTIDEIFKSMRNMKDDDETDAGDDDSASIQEYDASATIVDILCDKTTTRDLRIIELTISFKSVFPDLHGDKVTFIGSTFLRYGEAEPYLNHCVVLNECEPLGNASIETYATEHDLLIGWRDLIQRENPDIIIGYNIFGFDYNFMFQRAKECGCANEFLKLSRNIDEVCADRNYKTGQLEIEESKISIASGTHELHYIKMTGRLQIDLYNYFRREENLSSYKLDYVAGYFIGDYVKQITHLEGGKTRVQASNLTGLLVGSFIHFEEIGHTTEYYNQGAKFSVVAINKREGWFVIGSVENPNMVSKKVRWCLAKDDVSPKDIFRMTNGTDEDRTIIAKYCIQDCNLVQYLANKVDVITGLVEMSKICSVPMSFLVIRGQGIKLTSYVAKKCREKHTLMPVIDKGSMGEGYEGAIVLEPKCDMYLENPVACLDYASLYPSCMMSENLSHDSKVWTKEYGLDGELIREFGEKDRTGDFIYDNLEDYKYVDVAYDTYRYIGKDKVRSGKKVCRYAQFQEGRAIMPSILEELLMARKTTRKMIPQQTDDFMKNVLDKRQLAYKVTANSLYGQCGAKTSTFYDQDIAASTTATGRLLLLYGKRIIEECYGDNVCQTEKYGPVLTKAEYVYGDSVANYTPVYVKVGDTLDICTIEDLANKYGNGRWVPCLEEGKQEKEICELPNVATWTEKGWTQLYRVIRHRLASHKKMMRILTHTGLVDVTDDHSLILHSGVEISPKNVQIGTELLHHPLPQNDTVDKTISEDEAQIMGFFFGCDQSEDVVPIEIINNNVMIQTAFLNGLYEAIGNKDENGCIIIYQKKQISASQICWIANRIGWTTSLNTRTDKPNVYRITMTKLTQRKNPNAIKKIIELPSYDGYVYDLTTENHHFAAGVGNLIVHNTDSVFFTFNLQAPDGTPIRGEKALEITIELAQHAGHLASSFLKSPHDLEYEKTFMPFCLLSKKRYVGMLYEDDYKKGKRKEMGIVLKRRDNAPIVKEIYGGIIDILMKEQNIQKAIHFLNQSLDDVVNGRTPIDKLIITKSLSSSYKNPNQIAHKVLANRIADREPGNKPASGDRIPFIYICNDKKDALQGEKIETPTFIREHALKIDYSFYITNQIMKPVQQLFSLVLMDIWKLQGKQSKVSQFKQELNDLSRKTDPVKLADKIEMLKNKEVKSLLFDDYLRKTMNEKAGNQSITKWFGKK